MPKSRNRKAHKAKSRTRTQAMNARREKIMQMTKELEQAMQSLPADPQPLAPMAVGGPTVTLTQSETTESNYGTF